MIRQTEQAVTGTESHPTIWGLKPNELHDHFWAARGVQVVRPGLASEIVEGAELFLLVAPRLLTIFRLRPLVERLSWIKPDVMWVRINHQREHGYRETAITDPQGRFMRFERDYGGSDARLSRVALTPHRRIAGIWQEAADAQSGWRRLRQEIQSTRRFVASIDGHTYDRQTDAEVMQFVRQLVQVWTRPDATVDRVTRLAPGVWADEGCQVSPDTDYVGPAWIGTGRDVTSRTSVIGPAVLWDDPASHRQVATVQWQELEPTQAFDTPITPRPASAFYFRTKRVFDLGFAALLLLLLLPLFPLIMLAIYIEDRRPFFYAHRRETMGGREFPCLKFRSMFKNADQIKAEFAERNEVDGPQFYISDDPRLTRVGRFIRRFHIDELPQLLNVLAGHMSIVGPRPSPHGENQYCPPWREARLSVRPGLTGLWQVMRTRRQGLDFQEWIKYDIEYVEKASMKLDLQILWKTLIRVIRGG